MRALRAASELPIPSPAPFSVSEVARVLRRSAATIYALCAHGELAATRVGNRLWIARTWPLRNKRANADPPPVRAEYQVRILAQVILQPPEVGTVAAKRGNMKLYALLAGAVMSVVNVSAAQVEMPRSERASEHLLLGFGGTGLIAPAAGFAPSLGIAFKVNRVLIMGEGFLGFDYGHIDLFYGGAGGTIFGTGRWSLYVLAGAGYLARGDGDNSGREAVALTMEGGMVLARTKGGSQIWLGARGFIPLETLHASDYHGNPPRVPFLSLNLRFGLGVL